MGRTEVDALLEGIARVHVRNPGLIVLLASLFTLFMLAGATVIDLQTDISKELPQDLPIIKMDKRISTELGGTDTILLLVSIDDACDIRSSPRDIRDPRVIDMLKNIDETLGSEESITSVTSVASFFPDREQIPDSTSRVAGFLENVPGSTDFFNRDYTSTIVFVEGEIGTSEEKIERVMERVNKDLEEIEKPPCVTVTPTGSPPLRKAISQALRHDLVYTMVVAAIIIFVILVAIERSVIKGAIVFTPLLVGIAWTLGFMGWMGLKLSMATAGIGAMVLGLGTEYGIFSLERYLEEKRKGRSPEDALLVSLPSVGSGIVGSATTTMAGFLALLASIMPMIRELGLTLALGILSMLVVTIFVTPSLTLLVDRKRGIEESREKRGRWYEGFMRAYAGLVARKPWVVMGIVLVATLFAFVGAGMVTTQGSEYSKMLPEKYPEIRAINKIGDEFSTYGTSSRIAVWLEPNTPRGNPESVLDPEVLRYIDILEQKVMRTYGITDASSIVDTIKSVNNGRIPSSLVESQRIAFSVPGVDHVVNRDQSLTIISMSTTDMSREESDDFVRDINRIIEETVPPPGVRAMAVGSDFTSQELRSQVMPTMRTTSNIALLAILFIVCGLFWSVRRGLTSLLAIVFGTVWVYGLMGFLGMSISTEMSGAISMIMGIGIDFGIQVVNRYRQEIHRGVERAMETTVSGTLPQMLVTTLAALIGFRAMSIGDLTMLQDLGTMMSLGVLTCFLAAVTVVPGVLAFIERGEG